MTRFTVPHISQLNRRERLLAMGSLLVLAMVLLDHFVLGPWWAHAQHVRQEVDRVEQSLYRQQQLIRRKPQILAMAESYTQYLDVLKSNTNDLVAVLREIEEHGTESRITLEEIKPLTSVGYALYDEHTLQIDFSGTLQQCIRFIYRLQSSTSMYDIIRATLLLEEEGVDRLSGMVRLSKKSFTAVQHTASSATKEPPDGDAYARE